MNKIDELLYNLGIKDPEHVAKLRTEIQAYAYESAVVKLLREGELTEADKTMVLKVYESGELDQATFEKVFSDDHRITILKESLTEAMNEMIAAAGVSA